MNSVCKTNDGESYICNVQKLVEIKLEDHITNFTKKRDIVKKRKAERNYDTETKRKRLYLQNQRSI